MLEVRLFSEQLVQDCFPTIRRSTTRSRQVAHAYLLKPFGSTVCPSFVTPVASVLAPRQGIRTCSSGYEIVLE